jgi:DNA replication protein DnaC
MSAPHPDPAECWVCLGREALDDIGLGLVATLCCDTHAEERLQAVAEHQLRRVIPERHQPARDVPPQLASFDPAAGSGAFLYGPVGTGKSWAAAAMMKRSWLRQYRSTGESPSMAWLNAATLFADLRAAMNQKAAQRRDPMIEARAAWLLTIDDLGAERPSAWTAEHLYVLLNERYERMRPTLLTSNYDLGQLVSRLTPTDDEGSTRGEQLVSRIAGMTLQVPFSGDDRRVPT